MLTRHQRTGPLIAPETVLGGEGQARPFFRQIRPPSGWVGWIASVVVVSTLINVAGSYVPALYATTVKPAVVSVTRGMSSRKLLDANLRY